MIKSPQIILYLLVIKNYMISRKLTNRLFDEDVILLVRCEVICNHFITYENTNKTLSVPAPTIWGMRNLPSPTAQAPYSAQVSQ